MADKYRIIKLTFCGPSDVRKQMEAAKKIVTEWNIQHGDALETMVSFHHWSTDSVPDMAERAQAVINKQLIDESDLITAVFWNRFGTPSGMAQSGTEEEIRRSIDNGTRVLLYFAEMESVRNEPDPVQLAKVKAFKAEMQPKGLAWSFKSTRSFEDFFRTHLAKTIHELAPRKPARKPAARKSAPRQAIKGNGNFQAGGDVNAPVTINFESPRVEVSKYPKNSIGADADAAGYVEYMCDLWVRYKSPEGLDVTELWKRIGRSIKNKFKLRGGRTRGHITIKRFEELAEYLVGELKKTPVGRKHLKNGTKLCRTFEEFTSGKM